MQQDHAACSEERERQRQLLVNDLLRVISIEEDEVVLARTREEIDGRFLKEARASSHAETCHHRCGRTAKAALKPWAIGTVDILDIDGRQLPSTVGS